jgi:hypothetical protein
VQQNSISPDEEPPKLKTYAPPRTLDIKKFADVVQENMPSYSALDGE